MKFTSRTVWPNLWTDNANVWVPLDIDELHTQLQQSWIFSGAIWREFNAAKFTTSSPNPTVFVWLFKIDHIFNFYLRNNGIVEVESFQFTIIAKQMNGCFWVLINNKLLINYGKTKLLEWWNRAVGEFI